MNIISSYSKAVKEHSGAFEASVRIYRAAVDFFIGIIDSEWGSLSAFGIGTSGMKAVEAMTVTTASRRTVPHDFSKADRRFFKMPCYLRRAAIIEALGKVSSYRSSLARWDTSSPKTRGRRPGRPKAGYAYPVLYRGNMYLDGDKYSARIKVFVRNTWDWVTVTFRKSDADYFERHCQPFKDGNGAMESRRIGAPTLRKRHRKWHLDFPVMEDIRLPKSSPSGQTVLSVDLGIRSACTCCVMRPDGTVLARETLSLARENDCLGHAVNRIKKAQQHGAKKTPRLWAYAKGINDRIAVRTASFITETAVRYGADVIVMEHLDVSGRKRGSKKQRLHLWKCQHVQEMVTQKAHRNGIRVSRVCAWNTSRLAFDGSGRVLRGRESARTGGSYSVCEFPTGKIYNCDLNAAYNIGARYFVREILKSLPARERLQLEAKVPPVCKRSTCTLSALISLNAELMALRHEPLSPGRICSKAVPAS